MNVHLYEMKENPIGRQVNQWGHVFALSAAAVLGLGSSPRCFSLIHCFVLTKTYAMLFPWVQCNIFSSVMPSDSLLLFRASVVESFYKYWIRVDSQLVLVGDATSISKDVHFTTIGLTVFVCLFRFFGYQP